MDEPVIMRGRDIRLTTDGSALVFRVWPGLPPEKVARRVTRADILSWLEKGLPRADTCVEKLLEALNIMVTTVPVSQALSFDPLNEAYQAMQTLKARLPFVIKVGRENNKQDLADAAQNILSAVSTFDGFISVPEKKEHKAQLWHDDAMWLVYTLRTAMPEVKISPSGPGSRFLEKALQQVWGKPFNGDQIRRAVERYDHGCIPSLIINRQ